MKHKEYRNPHILAKLVDMISVDEYGSNLGEVAWDREAMKKDGMASIIGGWNI